MSKLEEMGTILMHIALQYTHPDFESMYSDWSTVHDIGEKLVKMSDQPQLNENQQMMSEAGLIGVIYSQLLEEFGFGYIDKDLWMIAENLSEKIANEQPQINENQQIVLEYLKGMCPAKLGVSAMVTAYCLVDDNINDNWQEYSDEIPEHIEALQELSVAEENQVLEVFSRWVQEQEEE